MPGYVIEDVLRGGADENGDVAQITVLLTTSEGPREVILNSGIETTSKLLFAVLAASSDQRYNRSNALEGDFNTDDMFKPFIAEITNYDVGTAWTQDGSHLTVLRVKMKNGAVLDLALNGDLARSLVDNLAKLIENPPQRPTQN